MVTHRLYIHSEDPAEALAVMDDEYGVVQELGYDNPMIKLLRSVGERIWEDDCWLVLRTSIGFFAIFKEPGDVYYAKDENDLEGLKRANLQYQKLAKVDYE